MKNQLFSKIEIRSLKICLLILVTIFLSSQNVFSQSVPTSTENYILDRSIGYPETNDSNIPTMHVDKKSETISYYNGLGKLSQNVNYRFIYNGSIYKDLVSYVEYDELGQNSISYLPYTVGASGIFRSNAKTEQDNFYTSAPTGVESTPDPYAKMIYEKSQLLRTIQQGFAGTTWQPNELNPLTAHTIKTYYQTNIASEVLIFSVVEGTDANISCTGHYSAGSLYKTKTVDENQVESYVFKDKNDKEILKMTNSENGLVKTYYVYDKYDRLRFIIPPEASASTYLSSPSFPITIDKNHELRKSWITEYKYDGLNREVEKIMPEEEPVWTIYDPAGRVVLRQDGIMRANFDWLFTKYDQKGRVIMTGIYHRGGTFTRQEAQDTANQRIGVNKDYRFYEEHILNNKPGYTNKSFPNTNNCTIYTLNYYDDYDFNNDGNHNNDVTFRVIGGDFSSTDVNGAGSYSNYKIMGHQKFDRINDKITQTKVLLFGAEGTSRVFEGNHDYNYNPPSPETIYYHGTVRLLPGFKTYPDQKVYIGPNVVVPPGTSDGTGEYLTTTYFYDRYGRVIQTQSTNHMGGTDTTSTQYEFAGKVLRNRTTHQTTYGVVTAIDRFEYDYAGRPTNSYKKVGTQSEVLVSRNEYNELGQVITKKLHSTNGGSTFLQAVDYRYNIRGWLKSVNDPYNLGTSDLFAFRLSYDDAPQGIYIPYQSKYNGNISTMVWINKDDAGSQNLYNYTYDNLNRLKDAIFGRLNSGYYSSTGKYNEYGITYDRNGNLQTLKRKDLNGNLVDDLQYDYKHPNYSDYNGNRLYKVTDAINTSSLAYDFKEMTEGNPGADYSYDQNGNMTGDINKGIIVTYNYLNLPVTIDWNVGPNDKRKIEWLYDATGNKLRKTVYNTDGEATVVTDYVNGFVYNTNYGDALPQLSFFGMSEGRVVNLSGSYELQYWLKDHLGNTRVAFHSGDGGTPEVLQKDFYYPFGLSFTFGNLIGDENKFKYNGKELEDEHGLYWYHYGVRYYDPQLGRWHTMDPADEFHSPYVYVHNDPVNFLDPDGAEENGLIFDNNGELISVVYDEWGWDYVWGAVEGTSITFPFMDVDLSAEPMSDLHDLSSAISNLDHGKSSGYFINLNFDNTAKYLIYMATLNRKDDSPLANLKYAALNSGGGEKLDFFSNLAVDYYKYKFFVIDGVAYNPRDAGNFMWGSAMNRLGIPLGLASIGAHANNNLFGPRQNGLGLGFGGWDSPIDQQCIKWGYNFNKK